MTSLIFPFDIYKHHKHKKTGKATVLVITFLLLSWLEIKLFPSFVCFYHSHSDVLLVFCTVAIIIEAIDFFSFKISVHVFAALSLLFSSVQSLSHVRLFATPWTTARQASLSITNFRSSLRLTSIESVISSLSSPSPPAPNPSQHQSLFQWVNSLHEVAKVLEFQL